MARSPRKSQTEETEIEQDGEDAAAGVGRNGGEMWTPEELVALAFHYKRRVIGAEEAKKKATKDSKDAYAAAERMGVDKAALKHLVAMDTPEGQVKAHAEMEARELAKRWNDFGVGEQDDFFAEDRTPLVDKAYAAGKVAAMDGKDCAAPYEPGSEQGQAWIRGWQDGQAAMFSMLKKLEAPAPILDASEAFPEEGDANQDGEGLSDEQIDAVVPPPTAETREGFDADGEPTMPGFLKRPQPAREPAEVD